MCRYYCHKNSRVICQAELNKVVGNPGFAMRLLKALWRLMPKTEKQWIENTIDLLAFRQSKNMLNGEKDFPGSFHAKKALLIHISKGAGSSNYDLVYDDGWC